MVAAALLKRSDAFSSFSFDPRSNRFRVVEKSGRGRFISRQAFDHQLAQYIQSQQQQLVNLADDLSDGSIDLPTFQRKAAGFLREIHTSVTLNRVTELKPEDNETAQQILIEQLWAGKDGDRRYGIRELAKELQQGSVSRKQLENRLKMYAASGKQTYHAIDLNIQKRNGMKWGKRVLAGSDKSCTECRGFAAIGWVEIDKVPPLCVGCSCGVRCRCSITYVEKLPRSEQRKRELKAIERLTRRQ